MTHFNQEAKNWDNEEKIQLMKVLADKTAKELQLDKPISIMDFGCGTGLFGLEFADFVSELVGVDTSTGMLEVFDLKTRGDDRFMSKLIDLEEADMSQKFDLIISSMAFHHLTDPKSLILKFKAMISEGGQIAIVDLDKEDGSFHPDNVKMGVKHFGFSLEEISGWAEAAGLKLNHKIINEIEKNGKTYKQFLAVFSS